MEDIFPTANNGNKQNVPSEIVFKFLHKNNIKL